MSMEQRLTVVTLGVRDLARARAFYEALGWRPSLAKPAMVYFVTGTTAVALCERAALAADAGLPWSAPPRSGDEHPGVTFSHNVRRASEVEALLDASETAGGRVVKPAGRAAWGGWHGYFADPDGHVWEVCHNPKWPLDDDGALRVGGG